LSLKLYKTFCYHIFKYSLLEFNVSKLKLGLDS